MSYWDFYTNRNVYKGNPKIFYKRIKKRLKGNKGDEKSRQMNLEEIQKIRDKRRIKTTFLANMVNVILIIGLVLILFMMFNVIETLYN